jgi:protein O-mannosyl-transferase
MPNRFRYWAILGMLCALCAAAYFPGLHGPFLFDDYANLPALGAYGPVDNPTTFWRYLTSGGADPTGRPLSLLSFLIDARDWPADPFPFKRTSLILHLLNAVLLCALLKRWGRMLGYDKDVAFIAALFAAAAWSLHPLFVSTTLYAVQREAMLPATFTLLGLLGLTCGYARAAAGDAKGAMLAAVSIVLATLLATACKANGALLPLLAWLVWGLILRRQPMAETAASRAFAWPLRTAITLPSLLVIAYLIAAGWSAFVEGYPVNRPWSPTQRLLTEARVLCEYLGLLWLPRPYTAGLFNDAVVVSKSLWEPITTLLSVLFLAALLTTSFVLRKRQPALAFAISFYFAGHLLESTVIGLELYYEHRNYLPALPMFWPLGLWLAGIRRSATTPKILLKCAGVMLMALPAFLALQTHMRARLWGNAEQQAMVWAAKNPLSPRAQTYAALVELETGRVSAAITRLDRALKRNPDEPQLALTLVDARCIAGTPPGPSMDAAYIALSSANRLGKESYDWFSKRLPGSSMSACPGWRRSDLERLLRAADANPRTRAIPGRRQDSLDIKARLALSDSRPLQALRLFGAALDADPTLEAGFSQTAYLAQAGQPCLALQHLARTERLALHRPPLSPNMRALHRRLLWNQGYWQSEAAILRSTLSREIRQAKKGAASCSES